MEQEANAVVESMSRAPLFNRFFYIPLGLGVVGILTAVILKRRKKAAKSDPEV